MDLIGVYESLTGLGILVWWGSKLTSNHSLSTERQSKSHKTAELITAAMLLVSGSAALLDDFQTSLTFVGLGMLLYASVNIAGEMLETNRKLGFALVGEALTTAIIITALLLLA